MVRMLEEFLLQKNTQSTFGNETSAFGPAAETMQGGEAAVVFAESIETEECMVYGEEVLEADSMPVVTATVVE